MKLSKQDADLFFKLTWSLQNYVNLKLGILPEIKTLDEYQELSIAERADVRDALYDNIELIDAYLKENPENFPQPELEIIKGWKNFKRGSFFIERTLKKFAVFIEEEKVYAVLALYESFDNLFLYIPQYVEAVLLPFKEKIIYDGLFRGYSMSFGGGIKFNLKETYMRAKQNGEIIESLDPKKPIIQKKKKPAKDWKPVLEEISQQVKKLRSSSGSPAIHSPAFSLAKASIEFAKIAVETPEDTDVLWKALEKAERALGKTETILHRMR